MLLYWVGLRFSFSSVTNSSSPEWSLFASPSFISSKPLVKRPRTMSLTTKVEIAPKWFDLLRPKDALVLFNQALGAAGTRIDQSSYSGQSGRCGIEIIGKYIPYTASSVTGFFRCSMILRGFQRPSSTPSWWIQLAWCDLDLLTRSINVVG